MVQIFKIIFREHVLEFVQRFGKLRLVKTETDITQKNQVNLHSNPRKKRRFQNLRPWCGLPGVFFRSVIHFRKQNP